MKDLQHLTEKEFNSLKEIGMLWEFYPNAPQFHKDILFKTSKKRFIVVQFKDIKTISKLDFFTPEQIKEVIEGALLQLPIENIRVKVLK
jgi:hypothetical protein